MQNRNRILTAEVALTLLVFAAAPARSVSAMQSQPPIAAQDAAQPQQKPDTAQPNPSQPDQSQPDQSKALVVTGTIIKNDSGFVLKDSKGTVYQLDAQDKAAPFENKSVKVTGKLEQAANESQVAVLHVDAIEPMTA